MQNAAIYFHRDGFDTRSGRLLGRHSAGESFLRGFIRHADVEDFRFWNVAGAPEADLEQLVHDIAAVDRPLHWIHRYSRQALSDPGVLNLPMPEIGREAWRRRIIGSRTYAICGITHTTATHRIMDDLGDLIIAPTEDYDALICTSSAVRQSVETQLDAVRDYLTAERGPRRRPEPKRVTIPLGVNTEDFSITPEHRLAWREKLAIPENAVVALYVGRFNVQDKMNPGLMAVALEKAAIATGKPIYWVNSGWPESPEAGEIYHRETRALCPSVHYIEVDGRPRDVRFSIWSVADFFISFSDNIQETFGLTPVEAMAAGLPCVVTDWDGYKDTVRHGEDGFRIPTISPPPGAGGDLAYNFSNQWIRYQSYVASTAQYTAIDYAEAVAAISVLVLNADYRRQLGENARRHARRVFDWSAIIPQYQALWGEQNARRLAASPDAGPRTNPFRLDPYTLFGGYPTRHLALGDRLSIPAGTTLEEAQALLNSPLAVYGAVGRPTADEIRRMMFWIRDNDGGAVANLVADFPASRQPFISRGVLWLARLGAISIRPAQ